MVMLPFDRIVFVDIPDPDNFFMVLHILKSYPNDRLAVVLNTRVLDLSVTRYDHEFGKIRQEFGMEPMAFPFKEDRFPEPVRRDWEPFFRRDARFRRQGGSRRYVRLYGTIFTATCRLSQRALSVL
jgi:hypothetical protein